MEAESRSLKKFKECLVYSSMRLGVPFIAPRQLGAVGDQLGRQFLSSVGWRTGQSGAPPDMNSTCSVLDLLHFLSQPLVLWASWRTGQCPVHTGQSGVTIRPLAQLRVAR
jgi:hypothetical protein